MMNNIIAVTEEETSLRLDQLLTSRFPTYSRHYFQHLIDKKLVCVNGEHLKKRAKLSIDDEIEIQFELTSESPLEPEEIPLDILYEDEFFLIINKPTGMVVHPGAGNFSGTFVHALLFHCRQLKPDGTSRPGIVHRLDKNTSGLLLAAKTPEMQMKLANLFANRQVHKEYLAITIGNPGERLIDQPIGRHPTKRKKMTIREDGRTAQTEVVPLAHNQTLALLRLIPRTGRTHQLRVHLQSVGTPILGDTVYGQDGINQKYGLSHQLLHAELLSFLHPTSGKVMEIKAPIPDDMQKIIDTLSSTTLA